MEKEELKNKSAMNITGFVCGIISIVFSAFYYIALPAGVLAVVFGTKGTRSTGSKLAKTALILGIIGLSLFVFLYIMFISVITLETY